MLRIFFHLCLENCQVGGFHSLPGYLCQHSTILMVKTAFQISSQEFLCCSLSVFPTQAHMAQPQLIPLPREVSDAQSWGRPWCPPAAILLTGVVGWALAAKICPVVWRWKRYPAPSSPFSKWFCFICTSMQQRSLSSSSEPNHSCAPLQLNTSEDTGSHLQKNLHGPQWD